MNRVEADPDMLVLQAGTTVGRYLGYGITEIDTLLGEGYAGKHPELLAAFLSAAAADFHSAAMLSGLQGMSDAIERVASAIDGLEHG